MDISKSTVDIAVLKPGTQVFSHQITHNADALRLFLRQLITDLGCRAKNMLICAEDMGVFCQFIIAEALRKKIPLCLESPLRIKRSLGIARGKNDRIDAIRIAEYAHKNISLLKMYEAPRDCIHYLQKLTAIRNRLIKTRTILTNEVKLNNYFLSKQQCWDIGLTFSRSVFAIKEDITSVDLQIDTLISSDTTLKRMFQLITSVPCIGKVIAVQIIIHTNEFKKITTARQFACYCGVPPLKSPPEG